MNVEMKISWNKTGVKAFPLLDFFQPNYLRQRFSFLALSVIIFEA
ncbi:hypothetical protein [Acinetobacter sp. ANC 3781]|jgi:hypothetical protein|nr:hypothetical protein [Acinetobacter sp. ANC 3781]